MRSSRAFRSLVEASLRCAAVGTLCGLIVAEPVLAQAPIERRSPSTAAMGKKQVQQARALHALNRLTFGPRPGDVEKVESLGFARWFTQQLHPETVDDSALEARLAEFPAMRLPQSQLIAKYPPPQVIRQIALGKLSAPNDPAERRLYADKVAFYEMAEAKREAKQAATANLGAETGSGTKSGDGQRTGAGMQARVVLPGDGMDPPSSSMVEHVEQLYSGLEAVNVINLPPDERMRRILAMQPEELVRFHQSLSRSELAELMEGLSPEQKEEVQALAASQRMVTPELLQARLLRDIYSERQLEAVMTDFWLNHFNIFVGKNQDMPFLLPTYEREAIRQRALGRFEDLLVATAESPAMQMYLDNWQSIGPDSMAAKNGTRFAARIKDPQVKQAMQDRGLNENYARELMELHTLGVGCEVSEDHPVQALDKVCGKGYTQKDVTEVAKVLTGWTIAPPKDGAAFLFEERRHEPGSKYVLGETIHEGGMKEGFEVLHLLATSPATAKFISTKLAVRFVSDTPSPALINRMTKAWMSSGGDIKVVLQAMVTGPEFWSPEIYRAKMKTPVEFVVSAVRASGAEVMNPQPLVQALNRLGMPLYGMQTPNGYNWTAEHWVSTGALVNRMNFALAMAGDKLPGVRTEWTRLLEDPKATDGLVAERLHEASLTQGVAPDSAAVSVAVKEKQLENILLGQSASARTSETVLEQFGQAKTQEQAEGKFHLKTADPELMAGALPGGNMAVRQDRPGMQTAPQDKQAAVMAGLLLGSPEFQRR